MSVSRTSLQSMNKQSAEYVIAHGAWQRSRGRNPSVCYLHIKDPSDALRAAHSFSRAKSVEGFRLELGDMLIANPHITLENMSDKMLEAAIKSICAQSTTAEEITAKIEAKFGVAHGEDAEINVEIDPAGTDAVSQQAVELVRALGGPVTKNGDFVHVFFTSFIPYRFVFV